MDKRLVKIGEAANLLGVAVKTLRQWETTGELLPDRKTKGGTRFYDAAKLLTLGDADFSTLCYARVSSHNQKPDLERQKEILETYCAAKGWRTEVISDLGSGMNFNKKGLAKLLDIILKKKTKRLVLSHKDRLLRFGSELGSRSVSFKESRLSSSTKVSVLVLNRSLPKTFWKSSRSFLLVFTAAAPRRTAS